MCQAHVIYLQRALAPDSVTWRSLAAAGHQIKAGEILRPRKTNVGVLMGDCSGVASMHVPGCSPFMIPTHQMAFEMTRNLKPHERFEW